LGNGRHHIALAPYGNDWAVDVFLNQHRVEVLVGQATAEPLAIRRLLIVGFRLSVSVALALVTPFHSAFNQQGRRGRFLTRHAYTVFMIYPPIFVAIAFILRGAHPEQLVKFAVVGPIAIPACLVVAVPVRRLPYAARVV
jgi:ABC-type Fe3+ transport system permease subunit